MTDALRIVVLLKAIRCVLEFDRSNRDPRMQLIKSVLIEAVKQCGETVGEAL